MDGFGVVAAVALVLSAFPGVAPAFARRYGAALVFAATGIAALVLFAQYDRAVGAICWWGALISGFVVAASAERFDRRDARQRLDHAELLAAIRGLRDH